ncbi:MAG: hypothetical protein ACOYB8_11995 [Eubacteriaceae bacterium]
MNPDYKRQNIKQQSGFSAEVKETANANAEKIINGDSTRKVRSDDLNRVNDQVYDHFEVDANGNIITGSGSQMKFVGSSPEEAFKKLNSPKYQKYLDNDAKLDVPSDYYDGIMAEADKKIADLQKQLDNQRKAGNTETSAKLEKQLDNCKKLKKNLRKSSVSNKEAIFAREHPGLSTAKDIGKISHRAGVETAKSSAMVGGSISIIKNVVAMVQGDVEPDEAIRNVAIDTGSSTLVGYGTGFVGSAVKGCMQNSGSEMVRTLSSTNLPAIIVSVTISTGKTLNRYRNGEINGLECFEELGQEGTGMLSSSMFAAIGQAAIPIPVVGALIGGMLGYALASSSYGMLLDSLKAADLAHNERIRIEKECEEHIQMIREYRQCTEQIINDYLLSNIQVFHDSFDSIKESLDIGDVDGFITGANSISEALGREVQFHSMDEFDALMNSDQTFKL